MNRPWREGEFVFCDLQEIARHFRRHNPGAALRFLRAAYSTFDFLAASPRLGRARHDLGRPGLRSWQVKQHRHHLVIYTVDAEGILIHRVIHGARDLTALFAHDDLT